MDLQTDKSGKVFKSNDTYHINDVSQPHVSRTMSMHGHEYNHSE